MWYVLVQQGLGVLERESVSEKNRDYISLHICACLKLRGKGFCQVCVLLWTLVLNLKVLGSSHGTYLPSSVPGLDIRWECIVYFPSASSGCTPLMVSVSYKKRGKPLSLMFPAPPREQAGITFSDTVNTLKLCFQTV